MRGATRAAVSVRGRLDGEVRLSRVGETSWRAGIGGEIGWSDDVLSVTPGATYDSERGWRFGLGGGVMPDAERAPGAALGDAQLSVFVDTTYEPGAASPLAARCAITFGTEVTPE